MTQQFWLKKWVRRYWTPIVCILGLILLELVLRFGFGFGNPPLLQADPDVGYLFQPNQDMVRFGKRITYNQYSQRSAPITLTKPANLLRILMIGDSILNGGSLTDQTQTISALFQARLEIPRKKVEVLNASAGSWGIGNQLGYLRKFGTFQSDLVILEIGAHDLIQPTSTSERLDRDPNYPSKPPILALQEVIGRYIWPKLVPYLRRSLPLPEIPTEIPVSQSPQQQVQKNLQFLSEILATIHEVDTLVVVLFIPELQHLVPVFREPVYKSDLLSLLAEQSVPLVDLQLQWASLPAGEVAAYFRDGLHLNELGNRSVANVLYKQLSQQKLVSNCLELRRSNFPTNGRILSLYRVAIQQSLPHRLSNNLLRQFNVQSLPIAMALNSHQDHKQDNEDEVLSYFLTQQ